MIVLAVTGAVVLLVILALGFEYIVKNISFKKEEK